MANKKWKGFLKETIINGYGQKLELGEFVNVEKIKRIEGEGYEFSYTNIEGGILIRNKDFLIDERAIPWSLFDESLSLLRTLAELQNGAPLTRYEKEWNEAMNKIWEFLEANEL